VSASQSTSSSPTILAKLFSFFASFGLATVVLTLLLVITVLGTLEQVEHGLFESQAKYFESFFITSIDLACCLRAMHIPYAGAWNLPILMPGGYLLMLILSINMICGGIIRIRKTKRTMGVILSHGSIVFMLFAGLISLYYKRDGAMALSEGQTADEFQSFHDSVIEIEKLEPAPTDGKRKALIIPGEHFQDLVAGRGRTFTSKDLPFELMVMNYEVNAMPKRDDGSDPKRAVVDGYFLQPAKEELEQERNMDGAQVKIISKKGGPDQQGIIWRFAAAPFAFKIGDEVYGVTLSRRTWKLPFAIRLDLFERELHPGTERARKFTSHVTKFKDGREEKKIITMNEPLRGDGFAIFQNAFDMSERGGAVVKSSTLQVVQNPSDNWPLYALLLTMVGLLVHMLMQLARFLSRSGKTDTSTPVA
jgi:cytochrome c biogenesis protein ResB